MFKTTDEIVGHITADFGGFLRCETCRRTEGIEPSAGPSYFTIGWPTCCGCTMRWWTARQVRNGEVPA